MPVYTTRKQQGNPLERPSWIDSFLAICVYVRVACMFVCANIWLTHKTTINYTYIPTIYHTLLYYTYNWLIITEYLLWFKSLSYPKMQTFQIIIIELINTSIQYNKHKHTNTYDDRCRAPESYNIANMSAHTRFETIFHLGKRRVATPCTRKHKTIVIVRLACFQIQY